MLWYKTYTFNANSYLSIQLFQYYFTCREQIVVSLESKWNELYSEFNSILSKV